MSTETERILLECCCKNTLTSPLSFVNLTSLLSLMIISVQFFPLELCFVVFLFMLVSVIDFPLLCHICFVEKCIFVSMLLGEPSSYAHAIVR